MLGIGVRLDGEHGMMKRVEGEELRRETKVDTPFGSITLRC